MRRGWHTTGKERTSFRPAVDRLISTANCKFGGADRDRTDDPLLAKQVLSQLSYSPGSEGRSQKAEGRNRKHFCLLPSTFCLAWWAWVDSNYRPHAYQACALTN